MAAIRFLVGSLVALAGVGFIAGVVSAVRYSRRGMPAEMPAFLRQVVTAIGGVLATNLGAVLGIKVEQAKTAGFDMTSLLFTEGAGTLTKLQVGAAYFYILGLLIALYGWWRLKFTEESDKVVVTLPQLSQTLLGVIVGVLAVALG
jgi:hypothetical protein